MAPRVATPVPVGQGPPPPQVSRRVSGLRGGNRGRKEVGTAFVSGVALPLGIRGHSAERGAGEASGAGGSRGSLR